MRLAVIYILLLSLLPGRYANAFPGNNYNSFVATHVIKKAGEAKFHTASNQASPANMGSPEQEQYHDCEDLDDEDANDSAPRKLRTQVGMHSIHYWLAALNDHPDIPGAIPSFWHKPSCRYILLRSIRI